MSLWGPILQVAIEIEAAYPRFSAVQAESPFEDGATNGAANLLTSAQIRIGCSLDWLSRTG